MRGSDNDHMDSTEPKTPAEPFVTTTRDGDTNTLISREAFEREAIIQRIVDRLRTCDLATLEGVATILDQGGEPRKRKPCSSAKRV